MNPFEMVVAIIAIVSIASIVRAKFGLSHGRRACRTGGEAGTEAVNAENDRLRAELAALKERVAVLERLATDSSYALEREFEKLKSAG